MIFHFNLSTKSLFKSKLDMKRASFFLILFSCGLILTSCFNTSSNKSSPKILEAKVKIQAWKTVTQTYDTTQMSSLLNSAFFFRVPDSTIARWKNTNVSQNPNIHAYLGMAGTRVQIVLTDNYTENSIKTGSIPQNGVLDFLNVEPGSIAKFDTLSSTSAVQRIQSWQNQSNRNNWINYKLANERSDFVKAFNVPMQDVVSNLPTDLSSVEVAFFFAFKSNKSIAPVGIFTPTAYEPELIVFIKTAEALFQLYADVSTPVPPLNPDEPGNRFNLF